MEGGWGWWASLRGWVGLVGQSEWRVGGADDPPLKGEGTGN